MAKKGKQFEKAVYAFVKALTPNSQVFFDHKVPDKDTISSRQVDAWIETSIEGHYPLKILISCKDYKRKLNISHMGTFINEVRSTSASTGIIYSRSGFTENALKKAEKNGVNCCQLFTGKQVPLPSNLIFNSYVCKIKQIAFDFDEKSKKILQDKKIASWDQLFGLLVEKDMTVLEAINQIYLKSENNAISVENLDKLLPKNWESTLRFSDINDDLDKMINLKIRGFWAIYKGRNECHIYKGSYCFKNKSYIGDTIIPWIDTHSFHLGLDYWEEVKDKSSLPDANMVMIFSMPDIKKALLDCFTGKMIK